MTLPLYKRSGGSPTKGPDGNTGLWFDKFCDTWNDRKGQWSMAAYEVVVGKDRRGKPIRKAHNPKVEWLEGIGGTVGSRELLEEAARRTSQLVFARDGRFGVFVTTSRFVTGLGRSHPVENGFAWHHSLGVPYLPGSSVKGLVRAWARDAGVARDRIDTLLGKEGRAGALAFLDAIPTEPPRLEVEVMTPHYGGWTPEDPPGDWRSPTPIPFLVTSAGAAFLFSVLPCRRVGSDEAKEVFSWLERALDEAGAGAKTSIGYGRFRLDSGRTERLRGAVEESAAQARAKTSPEARWEYELRGKSEAEVLELVRIHLEKTPLEDPDERRAFARAVLALGWPASWKKGKPAEPNRTNVGGKKLKERYRLLREAASGDE